MKSVLQELFVGNICPTELVTPQDPEYRKTFGKIYDEMQLLHERLSPEQYKQLEDLVDLHMETSSMSCFQNFSYGFKLGMLLTVEVFTGKGELIRDENLKL